MLVVNEVTEGSLSFTTNSGLLGGGGCQESEKGIQHVVVKPGVLTLFALFDLSEHLQSSWYRLVGTGPEPLTASP